MGPRTAEEATTPAEKPRGYPFFTMAPIETVARPAASAVAEPEIPEMITSATMMTWQEPSAERPDQAQSKSRQALRHTCLIHQFTRQDKDGTARNV